MRHQREDFDLLNNHWLPYQAISGRLWGRTGYYQQSGARGFRDQLQDSQVWLPLDPSKTLDQIKLHATRQFQDGSVNHWWHALADFGNHTACSDDYLWLPFVTAAYIRETGDLSPLGVPIAFLDGGSPASLLEHCLRSFNRSFKRTSPRGLPLIGSCDWNDGLSALGIEEKGESVWLGMFLCKLLADWSVIAERHGAHELSADFQARRETLAEAINTYAWDETSPLATSDFRLPTSGWYRYGTKDSGEWVGASSSKEGKIHLNAQTWAILSGIAPPDRARAAWESVKKHLLSPFGPLLLSPAYTTHPRPDNRLHHALQPRQPRERRGLHARRNLGLGGSRQAGGRGIGPEDLGLGLPRVARARCGQVLGRALREPGQCRWPALGPARAGRVDVVYGECRVAKPGLP